MGSFNVPGDAVLAPDGSTLLLTTGGARVAQRLRVGIKTVLGTYRYDMARGVPWFELLDKPNQALLRAGLYDFFLGNPEVSSIRSLEFTVNRLTRLMSVTYQLQMANGEIVGDTTSISPLGVTT